MNALLDLIEHQIPECERCGHSVNFHWPNVSHRPTTACVTCLDEQHHTVNERGSIGICTWPADSVWRAAIRAALPAPSVEARDDH